MSEPFFSVVIPALNEAEALPKLLDDLIHQSFSDFEVYVVDAKSSDDTCKIAHAFVAKDARFSLLHSPWKNVSSQRNLGAARSRGSWIVFIDADSRIAPDYLKQLQQVLAVRKCAGFTCYARCDSTRLDDTIYITLQNVLIHMSAILGHPYAVGACMGVKKTIFAQSGGFDPRIHHMEDSELSLRIKNQGHRFVVLHSPQYTYSLRRQRKEGKITLVLRLFPYFVRSFFTNQYTTPASVYPMQDGGQTHKN